MYTGYGKSFSIRLFALLTFLFLLPSFALAANDLYIKDADMVIATEKDWVCITKDTQNVDLEGTLFNYSGMDAIIQQQIAQMNSPQHESLKAMILYIDDAMQMLEVQLVVEQTEDSKEVWDISLHPEIENATDVRFSDTYITKNADKFLAVSQKDQDGEFLMYVTMNNGRSIVFSIRGYDLLLEGTSLSANQAYSAAHSFLDRVQFAKKAPKPVSVSTETQPKKNKSFWEVVGDFFASMWKAIKGGVAHEISIQAESIAIFLFGAAILGIVSLAKFLINVFRKR